MTASNASSVGRNRDSEPIYGCVPLTLLPARYYKYDAVGPRHASCDTSLVVTGGVC